MEKLIKSSKIYISGYHLCSFLSTDLLLMHFSVSLKVNLHLK